MAAVIGELERLHRELRGGSLVRATAAGGRRREGEAQRAEPGGKWEAVVQRAAAG